jgi:hypothetical protein
MNDVHRIRDQIAGWLAVEGDQRIVGAVLDAVMVEPVPVPPPPTLYKRARDLAGTVFPASFSLSLARPTSAASSAA